MYPPTPSQQREPPTFLERTVKKQKQTVPLTKCVTSTNGARSRSTFPCTSGKPLWRTAAGPGTSGKGDTERVFSFTLTSGRLGITAKGLRGVQRAPDQYAATHCLLGTGKNIREWGHGRQVLKGGALPGKSSAGACCQAPGLSPNAWAVWKDSCEGPSASFPTFTHSWICLSLERSLPECLLHRLLIY